MSSGQTIRDPVVPYALAPDQPVWRIVRDMLGQRTGMMMHTRSVGRTSETVEVTNDRDLELWVHTDDPSNVSGIGKHYRRIVREDGEIIVDSVYAIRSTVSEFHVTIGLDVQVNGVRHHQRRWAETFPRVLL